jgi:hypothetical protein
MCITFSITTAIFELKIVDIQLILKMSVNLLVLISNLCWNFFKVFSGNLLTSKKCHALVATLNTLCLFYLTICYCGISTSRYTEEITLYSLLF